MRWLLILLTACTTFDAVPRDTCGNGVLEPGEDCDSNAATCMHCAVTCSAAADCPSAAYACGVDGLCHAPGGALGSPVEAGQYFANDYRITDIDHDRIGDVVELSRTSIVVRHGDVASSLARTETEVTPSQTGPGAFGDLDNDGTLDVTIATADGLVSYASPFATLSPLDVQSTIQGANGPVDARMVFSITPVTVGAFLVDPMNGNIVFGVVDFGNVNGLVAAQPCQPTAAADFSPNLVDVYQVNQDGDLAFDTVVAMTSHNGKLCVLAIHKDNLFAAATITQITQPNPPALTSKPVLADLDNDSDRCPDVIATDGGSRALRHWPGAMAVGNSHCTLSGIGDALPAITQAPAMEQPFSHAKLGQGTLGVVPDGVVMPDGIWGFNGSAWGVVYSSPRPLSLATVGDVNGDGMLDVVLAAGGSTDVDVLYRTNNLLPTFQLFRVPTSAPVTSVTIGDFDGDGRKDLDYTEHVGDHERMMVAYDDGTRLGSPVQEATFAKITSIARITFPTSNDPSFLTSDLIVLQPGATATPTMTFLIGNAQRALIPYYDPRTKNTPLVLRSAIVGSFSGGTYRDVIAIGTSKPGSGAEAHVMAVPGPIASFSGMQSDGASIASATDCAHDFGSGFCAEDATYLAWPASGHDVVLGVDHQDHVVQLDPTAASPVALPVAAITPPAGAKVHSLAAADLDGDGKPELIATFDGALFVCAVDAAGMPQKCQDVAGLTGATSCSDAAAAHVAFADPTTTAPGLDLVAACHDAAGGELVRLHAAGGTFTADVLARSSDDLRDVRAGDVNGDGLDDIVAVAGGLGDQTLVVFPQCSSRNLASCQLGAHR